MQRRTEIIDYIRTMTGELGAMAAEADLGLLTYYLNLASHAAEAMAETGIVASYRALPASKRTVLQSRRAKH